MATVSVFDHNHNLFVVVVVANNFYSDDLVLSFCLVHVSQIQNSIDYDIQRDDTFHDIHSVHYHDLDLFSSSTAATVTPTSLSFYPSLLAQFASFYTFQSQHSSNQPTLTHFLPFFPH